MGFLDKLQKLDNFWIGVAFGILLPIILYHFINPLDRENFSFITADYNRAIFKMLPILLSRCIFPNAFIFFISIWSHFDALAKGILYSTIGLTGALILIQLISKLFLSTPS